jgi:hypothetical protein
MMSPSTGSHEREPIRCLKTLTRGAASGIKAIVDGRSGPGAHWADDRTRAQRRLHALTVDPATLSSRGIISSPNFMSLMAASGAVPSSLASWTVAQLRELAGKLGLFRYSTMTKGDLLKVLAEAVKQPDDASEAPSAPQPAATVRQTIATHVVFLPRDPQWAYVFWEISSEDEKRAVQAGARQLCLRVADVTGLPAGSIHPHALQEVVVEAGRREWFLPVPVSDRDYRVELGYRLSHGGWFSLAMSSIARMPATGPSEMVSDAFVPFTLEGPSGILETSGGVAGVSHEHLYQLSTLTRPQLRRVGSEWLHEHTSELEGWLTDSGAGLWASGRSESGAGLERQRSFWLVADAELIVYGATEPTATLFIGDQPVDLGSDGTFRVHVPFRDGEQLYPIRAVAADGVQERSIRLEFQRRTPVAKVNSREEAVAEWF